MTRSCSVVVITSALHAEGPRFEPGRDQNFFYFAIFFHIYTNFYYFLSWFTLLRNLQVNYKVYEKEKKNLPRTGFEPVT